MHGDGPAINAYSLGHSAGLAVWPLFGIALWAGFWRQRIGYCWPANILGIKTGIPGSLSLYGEAVLNVGVRFIDPGSRLSQDRWEV